MKAFILSLLFISSLSAFAESKLTLNVGLNPAGSFQANTEKVKGNIIKNKDGSFKAGKISVLISSLKTGIDLRDEHLWKHLKYDLFPKATLSDIQGKNGKATGNLEIGGIKKSVVIEYLECLLYTSPSPRD